jgi:hypothetical protein
MTIWWAVPAFVALIGILLVVGGVGRLFKLKFIGGGFRSLLGLLCLALALVAGLIGLNLQTYAQLTKERLAGRVTLRSVGEYRYMASIDIADNGVLRNQPREVEVTGEMIHVGGPVLKFKGWANVIGIDSIYRVDEARGSYFDTNCTNLYHPRVVSTNERGTANDQFRTISSLGESWKMLNAVDVLHFSDSGQPMVDGAVYDIKATQGGFELEPSEGNQAARDAQSRLLQEQGARCAAVTGPQYTPAEPGPAATPAAPPTGAPR